MDESFASTREGFLENPLITARILSKEYNLSVDQVRFLFTRMRHDPGSQAHLDRWGPGDGYCIRTMKDIMAASRVLDSIHSGEPVYPSVLELHLGPACPCACLFCYSKGETTLASKCSGYCPPPGVSPLRSDNVLSIVSTLVDNGCEAIYFSGGLEPFSSRTTVEVLRGLPSSPKVRIYTNGVPAILDTEVIQLAVKRASQIRFSIHAATPETYRAVQTPHREDGAQVFSIVVECVRKAMAIRRSVVESGKPAAQIGVTFLAVPGNYTEIEQAVDMWAQEQVDFFDIGNDAMSEEPRTEGLSARQRTFLAESLARVKILAESGALGAMVVRPSRESVQKRLLPNAGKCYAPLFKAVVDLYGCRWACCMRAHPALQHGKFGVGYPLRSGSDFTRFVEEQARAPQSRHEIPLPWHCTQCTEFEYVANICVKKLLDDLAFGIPLEEQPFEPCSLTRSQVGS